MDDSSLATGIALLKHTASPTQTAGGELQIQKAQVWWWWWWWWEEWEGVGWGDLKTLAKKTNVHFYLVNA